MATAIQINQGPFPGEVTAFVQAPDGRCFAAEYPNSEAGLAQALQESAEAAGVAQDECYLTFAEE